MQTRILIVDDDARFRGLAHRLLHAAGYTVVAEAADGRQALAAVDRIHPNAALVDVQLPDTDGLTLARQLLIVEPALRVVLTSTDRTLVDSAGLAQSGAVAFVPKDELAMTDLAPWLRPA